MLLRGTAIVSILTFVSRILGFVRDLLVARTLGASLFADAFFVAFRIPNLLRSFAAEGALTAAFVPVFSSALARSKEEASRTFTRIHGFLLCLTVALTALGLFFTPEILGLIAPGFETEPVKYALGLRLTQVMFPYIIFISLIAMLNAALNTLSIYGSSAWAQIIMNLTLIVGALCAMPFEPYTATMILAVSVLIGGIVQVLAQIPATRRSGLSMRPTFKLTSPEVREVIHLMIPATLGASVYQLNSFLSTLLASLLASGSISWLFYADRVAQFPIGIFSVALASVLLPTLANANAQANTERFRAVMGDSLRFTSFIIIPTAAGLYALATPITQLLFERGAFTHDSSIKTAQAVQALALGLWATSCYSMVVRGFIARKDTVTPSIIGVLTIISNVVGALVLIGPIAPSSDRVVSAIEWMQSVVYAIIPWSGSFGHVGLALASSISSLLSLIIAIAVYTRRIREFPWKVFLRSTGTSVAASMVMVAALSSIDHFTQSPLAATLGGTVIGAGLYLAASGLLRSQELKDTIGIVRRVAKRA